MKEEIENKLSPQQRALLESLGEQVGHEIVNTLLEIGYDIGNEAGVELFFQATKDILKEQ